VTTPAGLGFATMTAMITLTLMIVTTMTTTTLATTADQYPEALECLTPA
jgi:hypothetical protein